MNLQVKHLLGQLATLAVASFFLSCQDDSSSFGYTNPNQKFNLSYVDIPVTSSVVLLDSVRTSNFDATNDVNRLLVGQLNDPKFGKVKSVAMLQFFPADTITQPKYNPVFDSISLWLRHDFYAYGATGSSQLKVNVHELTQELKRSFDVTVSNNTGGQGKPHVTTYAFPQLYYTKTNTTFDPAVIGSRSITVDLDEYNQEINDLTPDNVYTKIPLSKAFGQKLFDYSQATSATDFRTLSKFAAAFKGLALEAVSGDKIIGFNPSDDTTKIMLHYHTAKDTLALNFYLVTTTAGLISYNQITADRSASELSTLTNNFYQDTEPNGDKRYVQAGTGVVTKIDFSKVLEFADTIQRIAINSAELIIRNVDEPGTNKPPQHLMAKLIKDNNRFKKASYAGRTAVTAKETEDLIAYQGYVNFDRSSYFSNTQIAFDSTYYILNDLRTPFMLSYSADNKTYSGTAALFFQRLLQKTDPNVTKFTKAILVPYATSSTGNGIQVNGKTLDRVSFNKNDIVLRVYYTVPIVKSNQ